MEEEKNIRLTVVQPSKEDEDWLLIDYRLIFRSFRRLFVLWLTLAAALGALGLSALLYRYQTAEPKDAAALIAIPPNSEADVSKITSPNVVESAMNDVQLDAALMDVVRTNIEVGGVIPDELQDRVQLYYGIVSSSVSANVNAAVEQLLNTEIEYSNYLVTFHFDAAGLTRERGTAFLNALLKSYQNYYDATYTENRALGSSTTLLDYREYDYAEALNIFSNTLDELETYIRGIANQDFRSSKTGYSFHDFQRVIGILRDVEIDRISSFITVNGVTSYNLDYAVRRYEWLIENLERQRAVQETRLNALTSSINSYEKDPVLLAIQDGNTVMASETDTNESYDSMVEERLTVQRLISGYTRTIRYYQSVIDTFQTHVSTGAADTAKVERYLSDLSGKVRELIENMSLTAEEYYARSSSVAMVQVLVPAAVQMPETSLGRVIKLFAILEGLIFLVYFCAALAVGIHEANPPRKRERKSADELPEPVSLV